MSRIYEGLVRRGTTIKDLALQGAEEKASAAEVSLPLKLVVAAGATDTAAVPEKSESAPEFEGIPTEEVDLSAGNRLAFYTDPHGPAADRFRFLRMRLRELWSVKELRRILITSPLPQDGKTTIALNVATALAEHGKRRVLFIEADLHQATAARQLGIGRRPGLAECVQDGLNPWTALRRLEPVSWYLLSAGEAHGNVTELVQSDAVAGAIQTLAPSFDWVVIDSPPVLPLTDALSLAKQAQTTLLVARAGQTPRDAIEQAIGLLGRENVLGIVLNGVAKTDRVYYKYYRRGGA